MDLSRVKSSLVAVTFNCKQNREESGRTSLMKSTISRVLRLE